MHLGAERLSALPRVLSRVWAIAYGTATALVIEFVSPPPSVTVNVTLKVPAEAHVFFVVALSFVSMRPFPQSHL